MTAYLRPYLVHHRLVRKVDFASAYRRDPGTIANRFLHQSALPTPDEQGAQHNCRGHSQQQHEGGYNVKWGFMLSGDRDEIT
jgi:hypothetical protein